MELGEKFVNMVHETIIIYNTQLCGKMFVLKEKEAGYKHISAL